MEPRGRRWRSRWGRGSCPISKPRSGDSAVEILTLPRSRGSQRAAPALDPRSRVALGFLYRRQADGATLRGDPTMKPEKPLRPRAVRVVLSLGALVLGMAGVSAAAPPPSPEGQRPVAV